MKANRQPRKTSPRKTALIFVAVLLLSTLAGGIVGFGFAAFGLDRLDVSALRPILTPFVANVLPVLLLFLWAVVIAFCLTHYLRAKQAFSRWDGEEEEAIDGAERLLSRCLIVSNIAFILDLFLFAVWCSFTLQMEGYGRSFFVMMAAFLLGLVFSILIQRSVVELEKKINPEKRGDVLDFHFKREWEQSFDEAERMISCQAAYKAFKAVNSACVVLWLLCTLGDMMLHTGLGAVTVVTVIWLLSTLVYQVEVIRQEGRR